MSGHAGIASFPPFPSMPDDSEISAAADRASDIVIRLNGSSQFRGMTYEEGVRDALAWASGNQEEDPTQPEE